MKKTPLKRKTPLKAHTALKAHTSLKTKKPLKAKTSLKCKQKGARKLNSPYWSIFTDDMSRCIITGSSENIHPHHIFSGGRKALSERYGFIIPLRADWHEGTSYSIHQDRSLELKYKMMCQDYYINILEKTKEEWIDEFGKWWESTAA